MKNLYFIPLLLALSANAQNFLWLQTPEINLSLNPEMVGYCTAVDGLNNVYTTGFKDNAYNYDGIFGDVFFNKYNDTGEIVFSKTFSGRISVYAMETDSDGNVIMDIGYVNNAQIGPLALSTVDQGIQPLLVKFDSNGNLLWHYVPEIPGSIQTSFRAMTVAASGSIFIGLDNFMNSYILKIEADGTPGQLITQTGTHLLSSLDTDSQGNLYAAGSCADANSSFASVVVPTTFTYNTWIVKYSPAGQFQWMHYVDDITCSLPQVRANTPDEVYFSSDLYGAFTFGDITAEGPSQGLFNDFFIAKLNSEGQFEWVREVPGAGVVDHGGRTYLSVDSQGSVCFVGKTRGTIDWGNAVVTSAQGFSSDALILKFDAAGNLLLAKTAGGASEDRFDSVAIASDQSIFVSGMGRGNGMFDTLTHLEEGVDSYAFVGKIGGQALGSGQFVDPSVVLWPNPVAQMLTVSNLAERTDASIANMLGQCVMQVSIIGDQPIDVSALPKGVYILNISGIAPVKFIKK